MPMSFEEFIKLATEWYRWGGDAFVECWDKNTFDEYVSECGPITKTRAKRMFRDNYYEEREQAAMFS